MKKEVNEDLYMMLIDFAEEHWAAFKQRAVESGMDEETFEEWFDSEK